MCLSSLIKAFSLSIPLLNCGFSNCVCVREIIVITCAFKVRWYPRGNMHEGAFNFQPIRSRQWGWWFSTHTSIIESSHTFSRSKNGGITQSTHKEKKIDENVESKCCDKMCNLAKEIWGTLKDGNKNPAISVHYPASLLW